jgi:hypothetical protein
MFFLPANASLSASTKLAKMPPAAGSALHQRNTIGHAVMIPVSAAIAAAMAAAMVHRRIIWKRFSSTSAAA